MKHLKMRWMVEGAGTGEALIVTDDYSVWVVARAVQYLSDDHDGTKTLQYICNLHNAAIAEG